MSRCRLGFGNLTYILMTLSLETQPSEDGAHLIILSILSFYLFSENISQNSY